MIIVDGSLEMATGKYVRTIAQGISYANVLSIPSNRNYSYSCLVSVLFLCVISYFNPCMNTSVGLAVYGMLIASVGVWEKA